MKLQGFVMAMANSWGLFLVIVFMGYGLVAVPRKLWYASDIKHHLNELYTKASRKSVWIVNWNLMNWPR
jgi:hypothetical protein